MTWRQQQHVGKVNNAPSEKRKKLLPFAGLRRRQGTRTRPIPRLPNVSAVDNRGEKQSDREIEV